MTAVAESSELRTHDKWLKLVNTAPKKTTALLKQTFQAAVTKVALGASMSGGMVHQTNRIGKTVLPKEPTEPNAAADNYVAQLATCLQMGIGQLQEDLAHLPADRKGYSGCHELLAHDQPRPWVLGLELPPFSVIEYAADVFSELRAMYHVNTIAYKAALGLVDWENAKNSTRMPDLRIVGQADAAGKSAAWFFLSSNQQYILKLTTKKELVLMQQIMQSYHERIKEARREADANQQWLPNSLLPQLYGMYTVRVGTRETHWIVMRNILASQCKIHEKYDLKGSSKGRTASASERHKGFGATLKCNDFRQARLETHKPIVSGPSAASLRHALQQDVAFLNQYHLIDYSLLVGIHHKRPEWKAAHQYRVGDIAYVEDVDHDGHPDKRLECIQVVDSVGTGRTGNDEPQWELGEERQDGDIIWRCESGEAEAHVLSASDRKILTYSENQNELIFYGIIDILTKYTAKKKAERFACGSMRGAGREISCQPPDQYGRRFHDFISSAMVDSDEPSTARAPMRSISSSEDQAEFVEHPPNADAEAEAITQERKLMQVEEDHANSLHKELLTAETERVVAIQGESKDQYHTGELPVLPTEGASDVWVGFAEDPQNPDSEWSWKNSVSGEWLPQGEYPPDEDQKWWQVVHVNDEGYEEVYFENDNGDQQFEEPGAEIAYEEAPLEEQHRDENAAPAELEEYSEAPVEIEADLPMSAEEEEANDQVGAEGPRADNDPSSDEAAEHDGDEDTEVGEAGAEFLGWLEKEHDDGSIYYVDLLTQEPRDPTLEVPEDDVWTWSEELRVYMMMDGEQVLMMNEDFEIVDEDDEDDA
jgi:1-phosphatidylinositol-4-phosphate 5-kinase